jgi:hypothetical protein
VKVACGERLTPLRKAIQVCFGAFPLFSLLSGSRQVSASLIAAMTPPQHTTLSGITIPRSISAGLVICCSGNLPSAASEPVPNTRLGGSPDSRTSCCHPVVYCCRVLLWDNVFPGFPLESIYSVAMWRSSILSLRPSRPINLASLLKPTEGHKDLHPPTTLDHLHTRLTRYKVRQPVLYLEVPIFKPPTCLSLPCLDISLSSWVSSTR